MQILYGIYKYYFYSTWCKCMQQITIEILLVFLKNKQKLGDEHKNHDFVDVLVLFTTTEFYAWLNTWIYLEWILYFTKWCIFRNNFHDTNWKMNFYRLGNFETLLNITYK